MVLLLMEKNVVLVTLLASHVTDLPPDNNSSRILCTDVVGDGTEMANTTALVAVRVCNLHDVVDMVHVLPCVNTVGILDAEQSLEAASRMATLVAVVSLVAASEIIALLNAGTLDCRKYWLDGIGAEKYPAEMNAESVAPAIPLVLNRSTTLSVTSIAALLTTLSV